MGEGTLLTEEVVEWREGERPGLNPLLSAGPEMGTAAFAWKGGAVTKSPEGWCREASHC